MANREDILMPVGRLVQGSLYDAQTTDIEGRPLVYKTGPNVGKPRVSFYIGVAIEKRGETHWSETPWGSKIWAVGHAGFPQGQAKQPTFAWKIIDGDDNVPNGNGNKPCDQEGFAGHWVVRFTNGFAPTILDKQAKPLLTPGAVNVGDYIEVYGYVQDNGSMQQPGVFIHQTHVAFRAEGVRIITGVNPQSIGFGVSELPSGYVAPSKSSISIPSHSAVAAPAATPPTAVAPYPGILNPPPVVTPPFTRVMTPAAGAFTYEQYKATGWTDEDLMKNGFMLP